jgi:pimeloyl-ACP methyl ester carboxylesterase
MELKKIEVSRGYLYSYYITRPSPDSKATLLFVHGFPSSAQDWHRQVTFFEAKGYRVVCPNLLGSGETARPAEPSAFRQNLLAQDVIDILDGENIGQVFGVGHDWYAIFPSTMYAFYVILGAVSFSLVCLCCTRADFAGSRGWDLDSWSRIQPNSIWPLEWHS